MAHGDKLPNGEAAISIDHADQIAELCELAGQPTRFREFLACRMTPDEVRAQLMAAPAAAAAAPSAPHQAAGTAPHRRSQPTPGENDALQAAVGKMLRQMYGPDVTK